MSDLENEKVDSIDAEAEGMSEANIVGGGSEAGWGRAGGEAVVANGYGPSEASISAAVGRSLCLSEQSERKKIF